MNGNCVEPLLSRRDVDPTRTAILFLRSAASLGNADGISFGDFRDLTDRARRVLRREGVRAGDSVLLADRLGPGFFAWVMAILAEGATVILVEPWMSLARINHVVGLMRPRAFVSGFVGGLWGYRASAVRAIPRWIRAASAAREPGVANIDPGVASVDGSAIGVLTFTSGTTGAPKGVVRPHAYLAHHQELLNSVFGFDRHAGPDLCVFANMALSNLASGRGSVIMPAGWKSRQVALIDALPGPLQPETLSCGPAFLRQLGRHARATRLRSIQVGGALTDCAIFEQAFARWPDARFTHVYGSSEAEPVAIMDAREAVRRSRARGHFQTLCLGRPIPEIETRSDERGLWVAGAHVCPMYLGNDDENLVNKQRDARGVVWHLMGDRMATDDEGYFWYGGRAGQPAEEFALEQRIYAFLGTSAGFALARVGGGLRWVGEGAAARASELRAGFPEITEVIEARIVRDRRHRARLDRAATLAKLGKRGRHG